MSRDGLYDSLIMVSAFLRPSINGPIRLHLRLRLRLHLRKLIGALRLTAVRAQLSLHSRLNCLTYYFLARS